MFMGWYDKPENKRIYNKWHSKRDSGFNPTPSYSPGAGSPYIYTPPSSVKPSEAWQQRWRGKGQVYITLDGNEVCPTTSEDTYVPRPKSKSWSGWKYFGAAAAVVGGAVLITMVDDAINGKK
jgi:hypothetical protein